MGRSEVLLIVLLRYVYKLAAAFTKPYLILLRRCNVIYGLTNDLVLLAVWSIKESRKVVTCITECCHHRADVVIIRWFILRLGGMSVNVAS